MNRGVRSRPEGVVTYVERERSGGYAKIVRSKLLKAELLEEKHPNEVKPTENESTTDSNDDANDETDKTAKFKEGRPSYYKLGDPVNTGDEKKKKLYKTALLIKPSHYVFPPN